MLLVLATCIYLGLQCNAAPLYHHRRDPVCSVSGSCSDILVREAPPAPSSSLPPSAPSPASAGSVHPAGSGSAAATGMPITGHSPAAAPHPGTPPSPGASSVIQTGAASAGTVAPTPPVGPPVDGSNETSPSSSPSGNPNEKLVFAHFMVGNAYSYQSGDWQKDIKLAHSASIDGFALNIGKDEWGPARVKDAYDAAQGSTTGFKMFLSLDMSSLGCASAGDGSNLRSLVTTLLSHPAQLQYNGKAVVSTFSGEACTFGAGSPADGWKSQFTQHPDLQGKVFFIPSFMSDPNTFSQFKGVMDGDFSWNSAWPVDLTPLGKRGAPPAAAPPPASSGTSAPDDPHANEVGSFTPDQSHISGLKALGNAVYMASVSPWFFTHYLSKNWIYLSDDHLYAKRWETLVKNRDQVNLAEIISWNDYGESHYIGPLGEGQAPDQTTWISGMPHTGWLDMTSYYATAFKTGSYPAITKDQIYMWSRPHPAKAQASGDPLGAPKGSDLMTDNIWAVVMATADGSVTLKTSDSSSQTFNVQKGVSKLSLPITSGGHMQATLSRGGQTVVTLNPQDFKFNDTGATYNFNAYVASTGSS